MNHNTRDKGVRRPYSRPVWEQVQLVAKEAVLANCKAANDLGKNVVGCKEHSNSCKFDFGS